MQVIEEIIPENELGKDTFYDKLRTKTARELRELMSMDKDSLINARYERFRRIGVPDMKGL